MTKKRIKLENKITALIKANKNFQTNLTLSILELLSGSGPRERKILSQRYGLEHTGTIGEISDSSYIKGFDNGFDKGVETIYEALLAKNNILGLQKGLEEYLGFKRAKVSLKNYIKKRIPSQYSK